MFARLFSKNEAARLIEEDTKPQMINNTITKDKIKRLLATEGLTEMTEAVAKLNRVVDDAAALAPPVLPAFVYETLRIRSQKKKVHKKLGLSWRAVVNTVKDQRAAAAKAAAALVNLDGTPVVKKVEGESQRAAAERAAKGVAKAKGEPAPLRMPTLKNGRDMDGKEDPKEDEGKGDGLA